jgi:5,5'-dehydrodivanillate O-demethylase
MLTAEQNQNLTSVGAGSPMGEMMRRYWQPIAGISELDERPVKHVKLLGESLVLYRDRSGGLGLIGDTCAHRRISMLYGIPEEEGLRCPYHGWMYDGTGQCIEMPGEAPDSTFASRVKIAGYPVQELGGLVFAYLGPEPAPLLPRWDLLVMDNVVRDIGVTEIPCNWLQCMENSMDPVHTEWLHGHYYNYVLGRTAEQDPRGERFTQRVVPHHVKIGFDVFEHGIIKRRVREGRSEEAGEWNIGHPILFPNMLRVGWTFQIRVPMDDTHTYHIMYGVYPAPPGATDHQQETIPVYDIPMKNERGEHITDFVLGQDMMAWATQGSLAERDLERLAESDKGIILYRRMLQEQMGIVEDGGEPINVFRDPEKNRFINIPVERSLESGARAGALGSGQAPYSPLIDEIEEQWANAPITAD